MTQEQKLQVIVEAAGEKWQTQETRYGVLYGKYWGRDSGFLSREAAEKRCSKWKTLKPEVYEYKYPKKLNNPSPADLNELFRLAGKLKFDEIRLDLSGVCDAIKWPREITQYGKDPHTYGYADTTAEALLNALYQAVKDNP